LFNLIDFIGDYGVFDKVILRHALALIGYFVLEIMEWRQMRYRVIRSQIHFPRLLAPKNTDCSIKLDLSSEKSRIGTA
jgi:hypothetical protein